MQDKEKTDTWGPTKSVSWRQACVYVTILLSDTTTASRICITRRRTRVSLEQHLAVGLPNPSHALDKHHSTTQKKCILSSCTSSSNSMCEISRVSSICILDLNSYSQPELCPEPCLSYPLHLVSCPPAWERFLGLVFLWVFFLHLCSEVWLVQDRPTQCFSCG